VGPNRPQTGRVSCSKTGSHGQLARTAPNIRPRVSIRAASLGAPIAPITDRDSSYRNESNHLGRQIGLAGSGPIALKRPDSVPRE
jgi:hypothetical protein